MKASAGQSVIEVVVAIAIFVIIVGGTVTAVLGSFLTSRLGEEETQATYYALEGINAVESIRNKDWASLTNGNFGLAKAGNTWSFSGSGEALGKYTRVINISDVERDVTNNVVSNGLVDANSKRVTSTVTWSFVPARVSSVEVSSYLTNWQESTNIPLGPTSCEQYCQSSAYSTGICRGTVSQCNNNGETNVSGGNQFCTGGQQADTCCCRP